MGTLRHDPPGHAIFPLALDVLWYHVVRPVVKTLNGWERVRSGNDRRGGIRSAPAFTKRNFLQTEKKMFIYVGCGVERSLTTAMLGCLLSPLRHCSATRRPERRIIVRYWEVGTKSVVETKKYHMQGATGRAEKPQIVVRATEIDVRTAVFCQSCPSTSFIWQNDHVCWRLSQAKFRHKITSMLGAVFEWVISRGFLGQLFSRRVHADTAAW